MRDPGRDPDAVCGFVWSVVRLVVEVSKDESTPPSGAHGAVAVSGWPKAVGAGHPEGLNSVLSSVLHPLSWPGGAAGGGVPISTGEFSGKGKGIGGAVLMSA